MPACASATCEAVHWCCISIPRTTRRVAPARLARCATAGSGSRGCSAASHGKFIRKHALPFPLLSDADHAVACAYGTWVEKSLYGRNFMGTERTTFVIGADGRVLAVLSKVKADAHLDQVLAVLAAA
jgi:hypothetical protein